MSGRKAAADATTQEVVAATILSAYYNGKMDTALARFGRGPSGLMNPPDDERLVKLLWGAEDDPLNEGDKEMLARAMQMAETIMLFLRLEA